MARDQRRLAAIVSADVAGYSRLMGRDESSTLAALKAHRRELIDPKIAEYGGRIVKTTGDAMPVPAASDAAPSGCRPRTDGLAHERHRSPTSMKPFPSRKRTTS